MADNVTETAVVGGVDPQKDLHVAAVVDQNIKVPGIPYFSTTRPGGCQTLIWMTSSGTSNRTGVECTDIQGSRGFAIFRMPG